jgi:hypothetical protein
MDPEPIDHRERRVDGNAAGGLLGAIFPFEMTRSVVTCEGCGKRSEMATLVVFQDAPGAVFRCPACEAIVLRVAEGHGRYYLDLRGTRVLQLGDA